MDIETSALLGAAKQEGKKWEKLLVGPTRGEYKRYIVPGPGKFLGISNHFVFLLLNICLNFSYWLAT